MKTASRQHIEDCENKVELKMVRFARHGTNEVCGVKCKSSVFYGTKLSNPQSSSIGEMYRGNKLEGISLPQAASRFSSRNLQIEKNQFTHPPTQMQGKRCGTRKLAVIIMRQV